MTFQLVRPRKKKTAFPSMSTFSVRCLSIATKQSRDDIHDFCCRHLWSWWSLFREYCIRSRINFYNITSENNSTFCIFGALPQIQHSSPPTNVHRWGEVNFCAVRPCFIDHLCLTSDFRHVPRRNLFHFLPFLAHCCLCSGNFHGLAQRNKLENQIVML